MQVSEVHNQNFTGNISFMAKVPKVRKVLPEDMIMVLGERRKQLNSLVSSFNKMHESLQRLRVQKENPHAQQLLEDLQSQFGIKKILESPKEGVIWSNEGVDTLVSVPDRETFRVRIGDSSKNKYDTRYLFHEGIMIADDGRDVLPNRLVPLRYGDVPENTMEKVEQLFDDIDFSVVKVRRQMLKPEIQSEMAKIDPVVVIANQNKAMLALKQTKQSIQLTPSTPSMSSAPSKTVVESKDVIVPKPVKKRTSAPKPKKEAASEPKVVKQKTQEKTKILPKEQEKPKVVSRGKRFLFPRTQKGVLTGENLALVNELRNSFTSILEDLHSISNTMIRSRVKNGYGDKLQKGVTGSRVMNFVGIGAEGQNLSINSFVYQGKPHLVLTATDKDLKTQQYFISSENNVMKTPPLVMNRASNTEGSANRVLFYRQEELEGLNLVETFAPLQEELIRYRKYITSNIEKIAARKERYSNPDIIGSLADSRDVIQSIEKRYNEYKYMFPRTAANKRKKIAQDLGFETKSGNPSILMRNLGPNGESLHVGYQTLDGKKGLKMQVLGENDTVKEVFYIIDEKLVKFDVKENVHSRKHGDRKIHFYSQEYIDNSGVKKYLELVNERLGLANEKFQNPSTNRTSKAASNTQLSVGAKKTFVELQKQLDFLTNIDSNYPEFARTMQDSLTQLRENIAKTLDVIKQKFAQTLTNVQK